MPVKPGDRIKCVVMREDPNPIEPGTIGTVVEVYKHPKWVSIEVNWDNGRKLSLIVPPDEFEVLP